MLKHLPEWFPGTEFKIKARRAREGVKMLEDKFLKITKAKMVVSISNLFRECFTLC